MTIESEDSEKIKIITDMILNLSKKLDDADERLSRFERASDDPLYDGDSYVTENDIDYKINELKLTIDRQVKKSIQEYCEDLKNLDEQQMRFQFDALRQRVDRLKEAIEFMSARISQEIDRKIWNNLASYQASQEKNNG